jgi:hypothetical protein
MRECAARAPVRHRLGEIELIVRTRRRIRIHPGDDVTGNRGIKFERGQQQHEFAAPDTLRIVSRIEII